MKEVVSGKSLVSLSATCQTTFDNSTPNHLNPQARVGEQLEVTINLENMFSTPLQLRNLQLLFKFESEGEGGEVLVLMFYLGCLGRAVQADWREVWVLGRLAPQ